MFVSTLAQLRVAMSLALGRKLDIRALDRLVDALSRTNGELGVIGSAGKNLPGGPELDDETRRQMQLRRFRTQATRAARETPYYASLFERLGLDPARLQWQDVAEIPHTPKWALRTEPDAFVRPKARPHRRMMTTGTTGTPVSVYYSEYELRTIIALSAIGLLFGHEVDREDVVQISTSCNEALGDLGLAGACARIGALAYQTGLPDPVETLALLMDEGQPTGKRRRVSVLSTYPSYLGRLVECGLRFGMKPTDFGLRRIFLGGEIVTDGLKARCQQLFGPVEFGETYAMTETIPFGGQLCSRGHLHFEPSRGLLEVCDAETAVPSLVGEPGVIVATPFPPYRETTLLLRYDTQDMARAIAGPFDCDLRSLPATTKILGKRRFSVRHDDGWVFPRQVAEALETVAEVQLPARYGFWAVPGGVAVEAVSRADTPAVRQAIAQRLEDQGVPVQELRLVQDRTQLRRPVPLRCDLLEPMMGGSSQSQVPYMHDIRDTSALSLAVQGR